MLSAGMLKCEMNHKHTILIINGYRNDLNLAWSYEYLLRVSRIPQTEVSVLDISGLCVDKQMKFTARILRKGRLFLDNKTLRKLFNQSSKTLIPFRIGALDILSQVPKFLESMLVTKRAVTPSLFPGNEKWKSVHSTFSTEIGSVEYRGIRTWARRLILATSFDQALRICTETLLSKEYCQVVVGNSRLVNAAGAMKAAQTQGVPTLVLERGARPGMLDTYAKSPHSFSERYDHAVNFWNACNQATREREAQLYLDLRREYEPISGIKWSRNMESGLLPKLNPEKKNCVFYSSSEIEFAVYGDQVEDGVFKTQLEAFEALHKSLNPKEWTLILRRHPYQNDKKRSDPESKLWSRFYRESNVVIVPPDSKIDSYALAQHANLVAHFNSSIGPEIIALECTPVITLGPNMWESPESPYLCNTNEKVVRFIASPLQTRPKSDVFIWAKYWDGFGERFQEVKWTPPKAFINGKRILPKI